VPIQFKVLDVSASAPITLFDKMHMGFLATHTGANSSLSGIEGSYPSWTYVGFKGVCHNAAALGLHNALGVTITPLMLTSNWSAMLSTGLYGYYGAWGGLLWRASEQELYERSMP
jgi:hypothetical protein